MAKKKRSNKKNLSSSQQIGIGVGLTTAAVAAAGAYFLYGSPNAAKNRKRVKSWMLKAKADVLETLENAQNITEEEYNDLVESIAASYGRLKNVSQNEVKEFRKEMKDHWKRIQNAGRKSGGSAKKSSSSKKSGGSKSSKKASKRSSKTTSKKTAKKTSRKK